MPTDDIDLSKFETDAAMPPHFGGGDWPTLNDWTVTRYGNDVCLEGIVRGHSRLPDGEIRTSPISRIAKDRSWAKTSNTFYCLGAAARKPLSEHIPDILQLIGSPDWDAAVALLMLWTKPRAPLTPLRCREALRELLRSGLSWPERRALIAVIRQELSVGHHRLADIWAIPGTDPDEWSSCRLSANHIRAAFEEWAANRGGANDAAGRRMGRIVSGWQAMAGEGHTTLNSAHQDPIALAHSLGEMMANDETDLMKEDANEREGKLLDNLRKPEPPTTLSELAGPGVVVIPRIGGNARDFRGRPSCEEFRKFEGKKLPLVAVPDLAQARATLAAEFPHAAAAIDIMLSDLVGRPTITIRPTLLVSMQPGTGKSTLASRIGEVLGLYVARYDASASNDSSFAGCARHWSTAEPSFSLAAVRDSGTACPMILIDEIDKASRNPANGSLMQALLPLLEKSTAAKYPDIFISAAVDLSHVSFILTANDELALQRPLRDRLRILRIPTPTVVHLPALSRTIVAEIAKERGIDPAWAQPQPLDGDEQEIAAKLWPGGSIRKLRAIVERILARRDEQAPRH